MAKKTLRYRKPEWKDWVYVEVEKEEVATWRAALKAEGYIVEG